MVLDETPLLARSLIEVMAPGKALMVLLLLEVDLRRELGIGEFKPVSMM